MRTGNNSWRDGRGGERAAEECGPITQIKYTHVTPEEAKAYKRTKGWS